MFGFREVVFADFEFHSPDGERQQPLCLVAHEMYSGKRFRLWVDEFKHLSRPPYACGDDVIFCAWYASAEFGCYLPLDWPLPKYTIDLYTEFRVQTNDQYIPGGNNLLGGLGFFNIPHITSEVKTSMRDLAIRGGPYTGEEKRDLLEYCESDVIPLPALLDKLKNGIDLPRSLFRGEYIKAVALMEYAGIPMDMERLTLLNEKWEEVKEQLIAEIDKDYGVFDVTVFKQKLFQEWVEKQGIDWPLTPTGRLSTSEDTFRTMAKAHPQVTNLKELKWTLDRMKLNKLAVGSDGRNRCLLSPFKAKTGRNLPSSAKYIFGPSTWMRGFIKPEMGKALAYIDWEHQEFGIAAALSGDANMLSAYDSGDPYISFAIQAGAVPPGATKQRYPDIRELYKMCTLAANYGQTARGLAPNIRGTVPQARELLKEHRYTYRTFQDWCSDVIDYATFHKELQAGLGWKISINGKVNPRSIANWPIQSCGSEMLRLAICMAMREGIRVIAPIHDAILVEADIDEIEEVTARCEQVMVDASKKLLGGYPLRTEAKIVRYPERYMDVRGKEIWDNIWRIMESR